MSAQRGHQKCGEGDLHVDVTYKFIGVSYWVYKTKALAGGHLHTYPLELGGPGSTAAERKFNFISSAYVISMIGQRLLSFKEATQCPKQRLSYRRSHNTGMLQHINT